MYLYFANCPHDFNRSRSLLGCFISLSFLIWSSGLDFHIWHIFNGTTTRNHLEHILYVAKVNGLQISGSLELNEGFVIARVFVVVAIINTATIWLDFTDVENVTCNRSRMAGFLKYLKPIYNYTKLMLNYM